MIDLAQEVNELRTQGLTDNLITQELIGRGYTHQDVAMALSRSNQPEVQENSPSISGENKVQNNMQMPNNNENNDNIYERIEQITESLIDEKWDELIKEVKKIIEWKERIEEKQKEIDSTLQKIKEDFNILHQGVLGKLEDYDTRMRDVGTELKAVGKVFKDVVPEFVENVKELRDITADVKSKKEKK